MLLSLSLILLLFTSLFFNFSFLSFASYVKENNSNPPIQNNYVERATQEIRYKLLLIFHHDFKLDENFIVISPINFANIKIFDDLTSRLIEERNIGYNNTAEFLLAPGLYQVIISFNFLIPSSNSLSNPIIKMAKLNATYSLKVYLQNDTKVENYISHVFKAPDFVEIYDYNGNNLIELEYGELVFVQNNRDKNDDLYINGGFMPQWSVFYLNNFGVFYTRIIPVNPTYLVYLFTNTLLQKTSFDVKSIKEVKILTIFLKYEFK